MAVFLPLLLPILSRSVVKVNLFLLLYVSVTGTLGKQQDKIINELCSKHLDSNMFSTLLLRRRRLFYPMTITARGILTRLASKVVEFSPYCFSYLDCRRGTVTDSTEPECLSF